MDLGSAGTPACAPSDPRVCILRRDRHAAIDGFERDWLLEANLNPVLELPDAKRAVRVAETSSTVGWMNPCRSRSRARAATGRSARPARSLRIR